MVESLQETKNYSALLYKKLGSEKINKIRKLKSDPILWATAPDEVKGIINAMYKLAPNAFKEFKPKYVEGLGLGVGEAISTPEVKQSKNITSAKNKGVQALLEGYIDSDQFNKLKELGIAPKITSNQNVWGKLGSIGGYPLQKILNALNSFPRATSGAMRANLEAIPGILEKSKGEGLSGLLKESLKASPGVMSESIKSFFNTPGAKNKGYWADIYKDYLPEGFSEGWEWTKDQDDWIKGTNWIQKLGSAVAGSPADIAGLATDIVMDPLTYITGGVGKGGKIANLTDDIVAKGGKVVVPKGATITLTKAGRELVEAETPKVLNVVKRLFSKELGSMTSDTAKDIFLNKKVTEYVLGNVTKKMTAGQVLNLVDTGGLKYAGQTIIPGFKFQNVFGKSLDKIAEKKGLGTIVRLFNPYAGVDEAYRPIQAYAESLARNMYGKNLSEFTRIMKDVPKKQWDDLNLYQIIKRDIPKLEKKLTRNQNWLRSVKEQSSLQLFPDPKDITKASKSLKEIERRLSLLKEMDAGINKTPELLDAAKKIDNLLGEVYETESVLGYKRLEEYFPAIYSKETNPTKWTQAGAEEALFQQRQSKDLIQRMEEGLKAAPIEEALPYRFRAGAKRMSRIELTDGIKQFGSTEKLPGWVELTEPAGKAYKPVKELKGWYFPKEFENTFKKTTSMFFGDEAARNAFKFYDKALTIWKRWALATPGYHFRNFYSDSLSGVMEYGFDFFNPKNWKDAIELNTKGFLKINGKKYTYDDFLEAGIKGGQHATESHLTRNIGDRSLAKVNPVELLNRFGQGRENLGRTVAGIIELKKGANIVDAAFNVKKVFFDYLALTPTEQNIMKRFIPFYTWIRKNIQRQVELLGTRLGGYASIPKFLNYLEETAQTKWGEDFVSQFKDVQPEYQKELGATLTAMETSEGMPMIWNPNLPFQDWSRLNPKDMVSASTPIGKIILELITNKDIFFGSTIDRSREGQNPYSEAPKWLSAIFGKLSDSVLKNIGMDKDENDTLLISDKAAYALRQIPPLANLSRTFPATETPNTPLSIMSLLAGAKFWTADLEKEKSGRAIDFQNQVNALNPEGTPGLDDIESILRGLYEEDISKSTKMDKIRQLEDALNIAGTPEGVSSADLSLLLKILKQPYYDEKDKAKNLKLYELFDLLKSIGYTDEQIREAIK